MSRQVTITSPGHGWGHGTALGRLALRVASVSRLRGLAGAAAPFGLGAFLGTAFEPLAWPYVVPICLAGLALTLRGLSVVQAGLRTAAFGGAFMLTTLYWLWPSIGLFAWVGLSLVQTLWFAALGCAWGVVRVLPGWPVWGAAWWSVIETARGRWPFGGFPWARLGATVVDTPWAPLLPLIGVTGTGLALALIGFSLAAVVEASSGRRSASTSWATAAVLGATAPVLLAAGSVPAAASRSLTVALVQGGVPGDGTDIVANHRQLTRNQQRATKALAARVRSGRVAPPDLVVWPENSTAVDPFTDAEARAAIDDASRAVGRPILAGSPVDAADPRRVLNQGVVWDSEQGPGQRYTKQHPVPFGEYIPFRSLLSGIHPNLAAIARDMVPGSAQPPLQVAGTSLALAICFDVAHDDVLPEQVRRGAQLIVVLTSNARFTGTAQPAQQFAMSRARALEAGRSVVIASTNGISGAIGPDGSVLTRSRTRGTEVLLAGVPLRSEVSVAVRLATFWTTGPIIIALGALLVGAWLRRRHDSLSTHQRDRLGPSDVPTACRHTAGP